MAIRYGYYQEAPLSLFYQFMYIAIGFIIMYVFYQFYLSNKSTENLRLANLIRDDDGVILESVQDGLGCFHDDCKGRKNCVVGDNGDMSRRDCIYTGGIVDEGVIPLCDCGLIPRHSP